MSVPWRPEPQRQPPRGWRRQLREASVWIQAPLMVLAALAIAVIIVLLVHRATTSRDNHISNTEINQAQTQCEDGPGRDYIESHPAGPGGEQAQFAAYAEIVHRCLVDRFGFDPTEQPAAPR